MPHSSLALQRLSLLTTGIAMLAVFILMAGERWYSAVNESADDVMEQALILSTNAGAALAFDDPDAARELLQSLHSSTYLRQATLFRPDGRPLAQYRKPEEGDFRASPPENLASESRQLSMHGWRLAIPIQVDRRHVGTLVIWSSLNHAKYEITEFSAVFVFIAGFAFLLAHFSSHRLRRSMLESQTKLHNSENMIRQLSIHRDQLVEKEHKRIALEIHDDLGQVLTAAKMNLKHIARRMRNHEPVDVARIDEVESLVNDAFQSIKSIASRLRPPVLSIGLPAALEWIAESMLIPSGIRVRLDCAEILPTLNDRCSITLFRIAQECLSNVVRHAHATHVRISLTLDGQFLVLCIEDDGVGFEEKPQDSKPHFGLLSLRERTQSLSGQISIESSPGAGTCIRILIPSSVAFAESETS